MAKLTLIAFVLVCYGFQVYAIADKEVDGLHDTSIFPLPVVSRHLSPGHVDKKVISLAMPQSLFVIGDDDYSRDWLRKNIDKLKQLNALGFVTNIKEASHLKELEVLAGQSLQALDVDELGQLLGITHYPFVLSEGVLWQ